jgi:hypothetical protein
MRDDPKPVRRIVVADEGGRSRVLMDGPAPDVRTDPARPGFASTRVWLTRQTPARISEIKDPTTGPHTLEPPQGGSVCRVVAFPPDAGSAGKAGAKEAQAWFAAMGSPGAWTKGSHPYMQKTRTLDFCLVVEGEITLVLDTEEVHLKAGDTVVQRGTSHAWSNRSGKSCVIAFSSHDAA